MGWNGTKIGSGSATGVARVAGSSKRYAGCIFCSCFKMDILVCTDDLKRLDDKKYSAKITSGIEGLISIYLGNRQL